ncbi:hypothetical protein BRC2024_HCTLARHO_CDS_0074 [Acinetobacter phage vB_AbaS_Silvergun]
MSKVVETKYGRVAFVESDSYFNGDMLNGSMGEIAKKTGAKYVLILGDKVKYEDVDVERAEELVDMVLNAHKQPYEVVASVDE